MGKSKDAAPADEATHADPAAANEAARAAALGGDDYRHPDSADTLDANEITDPPQE